MEDVSSEIIIDNPTNYMLLESMGRKANDCRGNSIHFEGGKRKIML